MAQFQDAVDQLKVLIPRYTFREFVAKPADFSLFVETVVNNALKYETVAGEST